MKSVGALPKAYASYATGNSLDKTWHVLMLEAFICTVDVKGRILRGQQAAREESAPNSAINFQEFLSPMQISKENFRIKRKVPFRVKESFATKEKHGEGEPKQTMHLQNWQRHTIMLIVSRPFGPGMALAGGLEAAVPPKC